MVKFGHVAAASNSRIPRHRHRHPREEIARVGRKDVGVSGESVSVSMSVSRNADLTMHVAQCSYDSEVRAIRRLSAVTNTSAQFEPPVDFIQTLFIQFLFSYASNR